MTLEPGASAEPHDGSTVVYPELEPVEDVWAWVDHGDGEPAPEVSGHRVTAVLVCRDADGWLADTLAGLAALERRPDAILAVDNGSADETRALLEQAVADGVVDGVVAGDAADGFGGAVHRALREVDTLRESEAADAGAQDPGDSETGDSETGDSETGDSETGDSEAEDAGETAEWLWLLHDDGIVDPACLTALLARAAADPGLAVLGPKLVQPVGPRPARARGGAGQGPRLSEVGVSIGPGGRKDLGFDPGELDQGQRDTPRDVLGVSTCGMLIRRDVWQRLDGLTPELGVFRDGVELGWRAVIAGLRVGTAPGARIVHRQVGRAGLRPTQVIGPHPARTDRRLGLQVVLGHARGISRPITWLRLVLGSLAATVGYLLGKAPGRAVDELAALGGFLRRPRPVRAVRSRVAAIPSTVRTRAVATRLRARWWAGLALVVDRAGGALAERDATRSDRTGGGLDELLGDEYAGTEHRPPVWRSARVVTVAGTLVMAFIAARHLLRSGELTALALLPAPDGAGSLWRAFLSAVPGLPTLGGAPWLGWSALLGTALADRPGWLVTLLFVGLVPFTVVAAYPLAGRVIADRRVRWWAVVTWAALPPLLGGVTQGRLELVVIAIVAPLAGMAAAGLARPGWRRVWGLGLGLTVLVSFLPVLLVPVLAAGIAGAFALGGGRLAVRLGASVAVPVVLLAPWWLPLLVAGHGSRLLFGPDPGALTATRLPAGWELLVGRAGGPGLPPVWLSVIVVGAVWLVAVAAWPLTRPGLAPARSRAVEVAPTLAGSARRVVLAGWLLAVAGLGFAVVVSRVLTPVGPLELTGRPWVGGLVLLALGGALLAAASGADRIPGLLARRSFGPAQPLSVVAAVLVAALSVLAGGWWMWAGAGARGPDLQLLHRQADVGVPAYLVTAGEDQGIRTLAITVRGHRAHWTVLQGGQPTLGAGERGYALGAAPEAVGRLDAIVRALVGGGADEDASTELNRVGIGYLWVSGADDATALAIGNTPGLSPASGTTAARVWKVGETGRAVIIAPDGTIEAAVSSDTAATDGASAGSATEGHAHVPAGVEGRTLVLPAPRDGRWVVTVDGRSLDPAGEGWQQAYHLDAAGGELTWRLEPGPWPRVLAVGQLVGLLLLVFGALPRLRPETRHPTRTARRAAGVAETARHA